MRVAVGAPVAERAWILPRWFSCLAQQTLQPEHFCFVYSSSKDNTLAQLVPLTGAEVDIYNTKLPYHSRETRNADPKDPWRAHHMARLRNRLRVLFMATGADVFVSLDTDILLEDPTLLERLVGTLGEDWDAACGLTYLHSAGAASQCYNAGFLGPGEGHGQNWYRADENVFRSAKPPVQIGVPMAFFAIKRHTMGMCAYHSHECGEDVGFAQSLARHKARVGWRTDLEGRHVWDESRLEQPA